MENFNVNPTAPEPWDLADLTGIPAVDLIRGEDDRLGRFFLSLAVAYNDLKGLVMFESYLLLYPRPDNQQVTPYAGQWRGLQIQIIRWVASVLHETMNVIRREGVGVIETADFQDLLNQINEGQRACWARLVEVANDDRENAPNEARMLYGIRNHAGFHYLRNHLWPGFRDAFNQANPGAALQQTFTSIGDSMETTRFYFADATVQQIMRARGIANAQAAADEAVVQFAGTFNDALGALLIRFVESRRPV